MNAAFSHYYYTFFSFFPPSFPPSPVNQKNKKQKLKMRSHAKKFQKDQAKIKVQRSVEGDQVMIRRTQKDIRNNDGTMRLFLYAT